MRPLAVTSRPTFFVDTPPIATVHRRYRLLAIGVLLLATGVLCVHYGAVYEANWPNPTADELAEEPATYDGKRVLLIGEVTADEPGDSLEMELETSPGGTVDVNVEDTQADVEPGGVVQVYGTLEEGGTVQQADRTVVVNDGPAEGLYKLVVSALAGVATAGLFLYYWRIDPRECSFEVRDG